MAERLQKELASVQSASQDTSPQYILDSLLEETQVKYNTHTHTKCARVYTCVNVAYVHFAVNYGLLEVNMYTYLLTVY